MLENIGTILLEKCLLEPGRPVLVGVSGGPDSLCLMDVLRQAGYPLIVGHFNHKLRPEADIEANTVERTAASFNVLSVIRNGEVRAFADAQGMSLEEAARVLRYRFLFEEARRRNVQAVAVGHTADDQVETVLMHFIRGAGLPGLKGMTYRTFLPQFDAEIPLVRPLLDTWREETVVYCAAHGLRPHHDPSNDSLDFFRNRMRHLLIPTLETYNPRFREAVWRTANALAGDLAVLSEAVEAAWRECVISESPQLVVFELAALAGRSIGLQRNLIRRALERISPEANDIRFAVLDRAAAFLNAGGRQAGMDLAGGVRLFREAGNLYVVGPRADLPFERWPQLPEGVEALPLQVPAQVELSGGWRLTCERWSIPALALEQAKQNEDPFQVWLDAGKLTAPLELRARQRGDRLQPLGMRGRSLKLSDFFINVRLPQRARERWPLICSAATIVWVPGYRLAHPFRLTRSSRQVIYMSLSREQV